MRIWTILFILISHMGQAQHSLEWSYGYSLKTSLVKAGLSFTGQAEFDGTPVTIASYEYRLHRLFGLGAGYTQQSLKGNYTYTIDGKEDRIDFDYGRKTFIIEPKFYYPLGLDQLEIYTGLRLGYNDEDLTATSTEENVNEILKLTDLAVGNKLNLSLSAVGINYFPIQNVGITTSFNAISPYLFKGGLLIRF